MKIKNSLSSYFVGPTAVGKTKLSIGLAKMLNAEIISGDSMQVYKGMDIGTAKVTEEETEGVPHHLIDILEPSDTFSTADYQKMVRGKITEIAGRGKLPMIVGGTGLYIQSVLYDYTFTDNSGDPVFRERMEKLAAEEGRKRFMPSLRQPTRKRRQPFIKTIREESSARSKSCMYREKQCQSILKPKNGAALQCGSYRSYNGQRSTVRPD